MDHLTKWPEVFPVPDQSAITVAKLLVSRLRVLSEILSDRGCSFLSVLIKEIESFHTKSIHLLTIHKQMV